MKHTFLTILTIIVYIFTAQVYAQENSKSGEFTVETTISKILGKDAAAGYKNVIDSDETIKWTINVPESYDPALPPGILIQMNQHNLAKMPFGWSPLLKEKNLIWISLNKAGRLKKEKEMLISVLATVYMQKHYQIDTSRVYIAASKDSCFPASLAMEIFPNIFDGVIYTTCEPINWRGNIPPTINKMKNNSYIFVASRENEVRRAMHSAERKYNDAGLKKTRFLNAPNMNYRNSLSSQKFKQAIELLDDLH